MAVIAFDAQASSATTAASSLSYAHTCTGSNLILWVAVLNGTNTVTGVTYNSVALTNLATITPQANFNIGLWYLIAPATGANNVVITTDVASNVLRGSSASYTGASQTGVPDSSNSATTSAAGTSTTCSTTVVNSGCWLVMEAGSVDGGETAGTGTTERSSQEACSIYDSNATVGTGSQSLVFNHTEASARGYVIASFKPAADDFQPRPVAVGNPMMY